MKLDKEQIKTIQETAFLLALLAPVLYFIITYGFK